ncbi:fimbrial protein (plasmid) [Serratia marcescens]|uniref:hypothetical protein n=1 Tax=Serratia sp. CY55921 TaxID=3383640 RepID=UPI0024CB4850|nr:fimbrial protein [Serratia marcescens]
MMSRNITIFSVFTYLTIGLLFVRNAGAQNKDPALSTMTSSAQVEITGILKGMCSLAVPSPVELGEIPVSALGKELDGKGMTEYSKIFKITTSCAGSEKYELEFRADKVTADGCLEASSGAMGFCLYRKDKLINLSEDASRKLEGNVVTGGEMIKVVPSRGSKTPVAGKHSGSVTVTIKPL